jgi:hypothetical protein
MEIIARLKAKTNDINQVKSPGSRHSLEKDFTAPDFGPGSRSVKILRKFFQLLT